VADFKSPALCFAPNLTTLLQYFDAICRTTLNMLDFKVTKGVSNMAARMQQYFDSEKFRKDMAKVGVGTPPYGHSTPTKELLERLAASASPEKSSSPSNK